MELRVMELMNNFPEGAMFGARDLGNYCVFGYYDALDLNLGTDAGQGIHVPAESQYSSWENRSRAVMRKINGDAKVIDLSLAFSKEDVEKEKQFWEDKSYAFLSVSIIRIDDMSGIMGKISNQNNSESRMVYYSYEHCEVLAAYHSNSYQDIIAEIHNLRKLFSAVKIYTIFAVAESLLENELELEKRMNISVQHERVSVRMNATMNNPTKIREFRNKLRSMLEVDGVKPEIHIYDLLGDDDLAIELNDVRLLDMLVLYKKDGLLNHSNDLYRAAFYNVETRFLVSRDSDVLSLSNMYQTDQGNECIDGEPEEKLIEDRLRVNRKREELPVWDKTCIEDIEWIRKQIQELKIIYDSCVGIEEAISSYIVCVVKMLNGLVQIRSSQQHKYEREILFEPMKVFTDYFIKLTEDVLDKRVSIDAKNKLIQDIESAVCRVSDIYENALNRTANTDKQMFMSLPVNASLYELSPKLYSHYADIVREMRYLFDKENQYAIFLNPTLKRTLKEEILFRVRKEKGKVVVVDIPVGTMDHYDFLPLCLVHEIFHVLTSVERKRKKRAVMMWMVLSTQIESMIFQGIQFSDRREIDADMKFVLFQEWFPGSRDEINSLLKIREEDRSFYAVRINLEISRTIRMDLYQVESRAFKDMRMVAERLESKYKGAANSDGLSYLSLMESYEKLKKNIRIILSKNQIAYLVKKLTHLFKETYADVASLLVVPNLKQSYGPAFLKSIQFDMDEEELKKDEYRQLRQTLVEIVIRNDRKSIFDGNRLTAGALVEYRALKEQIVEKQSLNKMEAGGKKSDGKKGEKEENLSLQVKATHVIINEILFQSYLDYLFDCKSAIIQRLENFGEDDASHWESLKDKVLMGTKCGLIDLYQAYEKYQYSS